MTLENNVPFSEANQLGPGGSCPLKPICSTINQTSLAGTTNHLEIKHLRLIWNYGSLSPWLWMYIYMMLSLYQQMPRRIEVPNKKKTHLGKPMEKTRFYPWSFGPKKAIRQPLLEDSKPDDHPPRYAYNGKVNFTSILWDVTLHVVFFPKKNMLGWSDITSSCFLLFDI